jgi:hypothetical protein
MLRALLRRRVPELLRWIPDQVLHDERGGNRIQNGLDCPPGDTVPVFLLTVFGKNEKASLSGAERNALSVLTKRLAEGLE